MPNNKKESDLTLRRRWKMGMAAKKQTSGESPLTVGEVAKKWGRSKPDVYMHRKMVEIYETYEDLEMALLEEYGTVDVSWSRIYNDFLQEKQVEERYAYVMTATLKSGKSAYKLGFSKNPEKRLRWAASGKDFTVESVVYSQKFPIGEATAAEAKCLKALEFTGLLITNEEADYGRELAEKKKISMEIIRRTLDHHAEMLEER